MSQPSRPRAQGPAKRRRSIKLDTPLPLEDRCLLAPYVPTFPFTATFTAATTPTNALLGTVTVAATTTGTNVSSPAPITSVSELTPVSSFGGDIVRIKAGPGGDFGKGVYAISRGAGGNTGAINRPGVIYRVDPATGKSSVFFDLNTVMSQIDPNALSTDGVNPAANSLGSSTGFVNWYDITFDTEGVINGNPLMLVSTVDRSDPAKNAIYMISPNGTFVGAFVTLTDGQAATKFNINPTGMVMPGPELQSTLRGLLAGSGLTTTNDTFAALYFNGNAYTPGQVISNGSSLPKGVSQTALTLGTIVGMTQTNIDYFSPIYSAFTDFGTPTQGGIPARTGFSGVQGSNGELLIGSTLTTTSLTLDQSAVASTNLRRFQDISFDQYGYFSQTLPLTSTTTNNTTTNTSTTAYTVTTPPNYAGSLFVSDLGTGLSVTVTSVADATLGIPAGVNVVVPVSGDGPVGITLADPSQQYDPVTNPLVPIDYSSSTSTLGLGGRVVRITQDGILTTFATGFDVSPALDASSFVDSELSITFSADGTTFYASDNDAIWQFKTTASLAGSTSGTLIGLNDLRTLGVPYEGQNSAVAVVDTGVDANSAPFRGRVTKGKSLWTGGKGNQDLAANSGGGTSSTGGNNNGGGGNTGGGNNGNTSSGNTLSNTADGHGTPVAGVVAQFVPQATIEPIAIFQPFLGQVTLSSTTTGGNNNGGGNNGGGNNGGGNNSSSTISQTANALTTSQVLYQAMQYVTKHPYVADPIRPGRQNRVIATTFAFGTPETFTSEAMAFKEYPQIVIALKNQLRRFRKLGIAPVAAAGQFGAPLGSGGSSSNGNTGGGNTGGNTGGNNSGTLAGGYNNSDNASLGDVNGMSMPAIFNETISVTGTYPFPYTLDASSTPNDPVVSVIPNSLGPVLVFGNNLTIGGTAGSNNGTGGGGGGNNGGGGGNAGGGGGTATGVDPNVAAIAAADFTLYSDRILGSMNRSVATDFAAPAIDVPTFRRTFSLIGSSGTTTTSSGAGDPNNHLTFTQVGTSMSSAIVTGSYALVASALDYWTNLSHSASGVTQDAYLTQPVGANQLTFGKHSIKDLSAYATPDGINGILAYTAVPVADVNDGGSLSTPNLVGTTDRQYGYTGSTSAPSYARVDVGNAVASIEGTIAINYLLKNNIFPIIDSNSDGLITAKEIQDFTDTSLAKGLPEAGAMARLLGGTSSYAQVETGVNNTSFNENPDQPAALQRRFNYFDYLANGQLKGGIAINSFKMLANTLLPQPDSYVIVDRQRASYNGFLVDPTAQRNFVNLQHILPSYQWVPKSARASWGSLAKYLNTSPAKFGVDRNKVPGTFLPFYTLFNSTSTVSYTAGSTQVKTTTVNGQKLSVAYTTPIAVVNSPSSTGDSTTSGTTTTNTVTRTTTTGTMSSSMTTTTPTTTPAATATSSGTTTATGSTTTASGTTSTDNSAAILEALKNLAQSGSNASSTSTTTTPSSLTPAGTLGTDTTGATAAATTAAAAATTTTTPAATTTETSASTTSSTSSTDTAAAAQQQTQATKKAAAQKAAAKKSTNFWDKLWSSLH
ncbi:hypothetical protein [Aquisphaera insulae]|uniref:hypothetical protein n=1 Tax=Aquisphaera insulae TaxID=2712864 RepID=UPI0013EC7D49|nr:hypothetical protein [Aquisphaera insulae]